MQFDILLDFVAILAEMVRGVEVMKGAEWRSGFLFVGVVVWKTKWGGGLPLIHFGDNASLFCFLLGAVMRDEGKQPPLMGMDESAGCFFFHFITTMWIIIGPGSISIHELESRYMLVDIDKSCFEENCGRGGFNCCLKVVIGLIIIG